MLTLSCSTSAVTAPQMSTEVLTAEAVKGTVMLSFIEGRAWILDTEDEPRHHSTTAFFSSEFIQALMPTWWLFGFEED